jgi:hypothetical protein
MSNIKVLLSKHEVLTTTLRLQQTHIQTLMEKPHKRDGYQKVQLQSGPRLRMVHTKVQKRLVHGVGDAAAAWHEELRGDLNSSFSSPHSSYNILRSS